MFHTELIENYLKYVSGQLYVSFWVVVTVALNFEESRAYVKFRCFHARNGKNKLN